MGKKIARNPGVIMNEFDACIEVTIPLETLGKSVASFKPIDDLDYFDRSLTIPREEWEFLGRPLAVTVRVQGTQK